MIPHHLNKGTTCYNKEDFVAAPFSALTSIWARAFFIDISESQTSKIPRLVLMQSDLSTDHAYPETFTTHNLLSCLHIYISIYKRSTVNFR